MSDVDGTRVIDATAGGVEFGGAGAAEAALDGLDRVKDFQRLRLRADPLARQRVHHCAVEEIRGLEAPGRCFNDAGEVFIPCPEGFVEHGERRLYVCAAVAHVGAEGEVQMDHLT